MRGARAIGVTLALAAVAAGAEGAVAGAQSPQSTPRLRVAPSWGRAATTFTVHFTAPDPSGSNGTTTHQYALTAQARRSGSGCIRSVALQPTATKADEAMAVRLMPHHLGGHWCTTSYPGRVVETIRPACGGPIVAQSADADGTRGTTVTRDAVACPQYIALRVIGTFTLTVRHKSGH